MLEVRHRFLIGSGRPSVLMLIRSAPALATMRPVLFSAEADILKIRLGGEGIGLVFKQKNNVSVTGNHSDRPCPYF